MGPARAARARQRRDLPTGKIRILAGEKQLSGGQPCEKEPAFQPELYDPGADALANGSSDLLAATPVDNALLPPAQYPRGYHVLAVLLPDARVLLAGGEIINNIDSRFTGEIFSPPYLYYGFRPSIRAGSTDALYGQSFELTVHHTNANVQLERLVILRPACVTHHFDVEQRYVDIVDYTVQQEPVFSLPPGWAHKLTVPTPTSDLVPPGYYMVFAIDVETATGRRAPSAAHFIRIH